MYNTAIIKATGERINVISRTNDRTGITTTRGERWNKNKENFEEFPITLDEVIVVPTFYTKENEEVLKQIREALLNTGYAEVHNQYETFYGVGFDRWLREGLADLEPTYEILMVNKWEGYPWIYLINVDIDLLAGSAPHPKYNDK